MKKYLIFLAAIFLCVSCGYSKNKAAKTTKESAPASKIDFDMRNLNYNMVSAITFEMLVDPQKYDGKTAAISGQFYSEVYEGTRYYSVIVWDATLCCPAGMDFIPPEGLSYPKDFPQDEQKITVYGTLELEDTTDGSQLYFIADKIEF